MDMQTLAVVQTAAAIGSFLVQLIAAAWEVARRRSARKRREQEGESGKSPENE